MIAVLTADLSSSTSYSKELLDKALTALNKEFEELDKKNNSKKPQFKIYRGDSFQGIIHKPENALHIALQIKTAINKIYTQESSTNKAYSREADLKMAIGIGSYDFKRKNILESNGEAFQFSGRILDEMKTESRKTRLKTPSISINEEFNASLFLLDILAEKWSTASAEVIYYALKGLKETEIAKILKISQSAVNQRKKAAGWEAIDVLLKRYQSVISNYIAHAN
tara:strand:+ start:236 stop:910 length:675 start_codon:yes stop_codon:yes gene_type:complete